jgi:hypothetical protein
MYFLGTRGPRDSSEQRSMEVHIADSTLTTFVFVFAKGIGALGAGSDYTIRILAPRHPAT